MRTDRVLSKVCRIWIGTLVSEYLVLLRHSLLALCQHLLRVTILRQDCNSFRTGRLRRFIVHGRSVCGALLFNLRCHVVHTVGRSCCVLRCVELKTLWSRGLIILWLLQGLITIVRFSYSCTEWHLLLGWVVWLTPQRVLSVTDQSWSSLMAQRPTCSFTAAKARLHKRDSWLGCSHHFLFIVNLSGCTSQENSWSLCSDRLVWYEE